MFGNKKDGFDKNIVIHVGRKDKTVPYIGKGRRVIDPSLGRCYEIYLVNNPKIKYKINDIPTEFVSSSGVIELYTNDFEQFSPCNLLDKKGKSKPIKDAKKNKVGKANVKLAKDCDLNLYLLSSEQKVWYAKAVKEDFDKTMKKAWWNENKNIMLVVIVLAALCVISYILMNGISGAGAMARDIITAAAKGADVLVNSSAIPPI